MSGIKSMLRTIAFGVASAIVNSGAQGTPVQSAHDLIKDVVFNELQDRGRDSFWEYRIDRTTGSSRMIFEQIETGHGPIHKLLTRDGQPLTSVQEREETARLDQLLQSPSDQARVEQQYQQDEQRLQRLMTLMPDAFLYEYDGPQNGGLVRLRFAPNPDFRPPTFEARIFHALAGTLWVSEGPKRMTHLQGKIVDRVDFGWGLLGHIEKGGAFEIERVPVNQTHWKTALVDVHIDGKVVFFKTVAQHQHEIRSGFKAVPTDITLPQARAILDRVAIESTSSEAARRVARVAGR